MRGFIFSILICAVSLSARGSEEKITEQAVLQVLAAFDDAQSKKDTAACLRLLTEDFTMTSMLEDGTVRARMGLSEYNHFLTELFTEAAEYKHSRGKVTVQVADDGKTATARYETFQHVERADKEKLNWSNLETDTFVLRGDKVLLSKVETVVMSPNQTAP